MYDSLPMSLPNSYGSYVTGITGSQFILPVAAYSWSVLTQSGTAFINGYPVFAGQAPIVGGRYAGFKMNGSTTVVVGCTGGRVLINYDA